MKSSQPHPPQSGSKLPHSKELRDEQYRDGANLSARMALHTRFSSNSTQWPGWVFDRLPNLDSAMVLEIGCGTGRLWSHNDDRLPRGWEVYLSDFSHGMLADARRALTEQPFHFLVADAQALPFPAGAFDCVIANHMLYHVPDRPRALREIARLLAADGCLIAATVGDRHLAELDTLLSDCGAPIGLGASMAETFTLQNGAAQLAEVFEEVALERYPSTLRVTEVEPVVAYVQSIPAADELAATVLERIRRTVARDIAERGAFEIGTDTGLFIARRTGPR